MIITSQTVPSPKAHQTWAEPPEVHPGWTEPPPSPLVIPVPAEPVADPPRRPDIIIYSTIITMQIIQFLATLLLLMRT